MNLKITYENENLSSINRILQILSIEWTTKNKGEKLLLHQEHQNFKENIICTNSGNVMESLSQYSLCLYTRKWNKSENSYLELRHCKVLKYWTKSNLHSFSKYLPSTGEDVQGK